MDVAVCNNSSITKKEHKNREKYQGPIEQLQNGESEDNRDHLSTWGCDLPKLQKRLQQIPGPTSGIFIQSERYHINIDLKKKQAFIVHQIKVLQ